MAIGHAVRGAASAALTLIVLEAVGTDRSGKVGSFFGDVSRLLARAVSPDVPLIPDRRATATPDAGFITPATAAMAGRLAVDIPAAAAITGPGGIGGAGLGQYNAGGGLPAGILNNPSLPVAPGPNPYLLPTDTLP